MARIETPKRVRGTQDIFGEEQRRFAQVLATFEHVHGLYAFQRLDLPVFEDTQVFARSIGHMSAFMAQAGTLTVLGDAGEALGDSLYEAKLYVRGSVKSLGADCIEKEMRDEHLRELADKLAAAGLAGEVNPSEFRRYGSARTLYHFHVDNAGAY